jgi:hypothetical protein
MAPKRPVEPRAPGNTLHILETGQGAHRPRRLAGVGDRWHRLINRRRALHDWCPRVSGRIRARADQGANGIEADGIAGRGSGATEILCGTDTGPTTVFLYVHAVCRRTQRTGCARTYTDFPQGSPRTRTALTVNPRNSPGRNRSPDPLRRDGETVPIPSPGFSGGVNTVDGLKEQRQPRACTVPVDLHRPAITAPTASALTPSPVSHPPLRCSSITLSTSSSAWA